MRDLQPQLAVLPERLAAHLTLVGVALAAGLLLSAPLTLWALRSPRARWGVLAVASAVQTVPGLALLALMVPFLDLLGTRLGVAVPAFGFWPAALALTLYSMLPILRNAVTGLAGVRPSLLEAATGLGMTPGQVLTRVQLPLAAPVILAGIRTSAVWTVGIATLSTPVGQTSLGNYLFAGLQTRNWTAVLVGVVAAAGLALVLDLALASVERAAARRRRGPLAVGAGLLAALALIAVWPVLGGGAGPAGGHPVRLGGKTFTEQYILLALLEDTLHDAGFATERRESLGSTVLFDALAQGDIEVAVDYSGTIWANHMGRRDVQDAEAVAEAVGDWLSTRHDILSLGSLGFENAYGLAMRRDRAQALGVATLGDLAAHAPDLSLGGDYEFFGRPEFDRLRSIYGLSFGRKVSFDSTFMYEAVRRGEVDVITAFTSDGRIDAYDLVVLDDPERAFPPYDALLLVAGAAARRRPGLLEALRPLVGAISVDAMRRANALVDVQGRSRAEAAESLAAEVFEAAGDRTSGPE